MKTTMLLVAAAAMTILPASSAVRGVQTLAAREQPAPLPSLDAAELARVPRPALDPARPTAVVLLGTDLTEITDALGPYEMFVRAGRYNVVTASVERRPSLLTGGLEILPHYALSEIDDILGAPPAVVIVPNIPNAPSVENRPLIDWIRAQAQGGAIIHSWCKGAMAVAETGLLDGKSATAHWGDIDKLERRYPRVRWERGVRWVEHGQFIMSAGITSGIDASLRAIARLVHDSVARRVARELRYHDYRRAIDPSAEQYTLRAGDLVMVANAAYRLTRPTLALGVYDGVNEMDLSTVYDAHVHTMAAQVLTVGLETGFVLTAHGLTVRPSLGLARADARRLLNDVDRFIVPGVESRLQAEALVTAAAAAAPRLAAEQVHADQPLRFGLEPVLEDLARTADVPTARFAQRRMEYRAETVQLAGPASAWNPLAFAVLQGATGLLMLLAVRYALSRFAGRGTRAPGLVSANS